MNLSIIAAIGKNREIGFQNGLYRTSMYFNISTAVNADIKLRLSRMFVVKSPNKPINIVFVFLVIRLSCKQQPISL